MKDKKKTGPKEGEVDAVYLWVDSNNEKFIKQKNKHSKQFKINTFWSATRDHSEILHSIKSVRKYAKWIRNIYVICPKGHKIRKLNEKKHNVTYINHESILGEENCPNFNSSALELFQHNIPGLSEYFLAFNDDFFINEIINLEDFFDFKENKIKYYYEKRLQLGKPFSPTTSKILQDMFPDEKYYFWMCHMPRMFYKKHLEEIVKKYEELSEKTKASKFRNKEDIQVVYLYGYILLSKNRGEFIFLKNLAEENRKSLIKMLFLKIKTEGLLETLKQVYLQFIHINKLTKNKLFSEEKIYSLININNDYSHNKKLIEKAIKEKTKFVCLNDCYDSENAELRTKVEEENYKYFYELLKEKKQVKNE